MGRLVEESETAVFAAGEERHRALAPLAPGRVGLVNGRMRAHDKDNAMAGFAGGEVDLLVATTVIEVGVDLRDATVMVIEHAERFGLAQLHQLRGASAAVTSPRPTCCSTSRRSARSPSGASRYCASRGRFRIAEEDLRLRGAGEVLGTRQIGLPSLRLADLAAHEQLIAIAHDDARLVLEHEPHLESEHGHALRILLYLFRRDEAVQYLRAG